MGTTPLPPLPLPADEGERPVGFLAMTGEPPLAQHAWTALLVPGVAMLVAGGMDGAEDAFSLVALGVPGLACISAAVLLRVAARRRAARGEPYGAWVTGRRVVVRPVPLAWDRPVAIPLDEAEVEVRRYRAREAVWVRRRGTRGVRLEPSCFSTYPTAAGLRDALAALLDEARGAVRG